MNNDDARNIEDIFHQIVAARGLRLGERAGMHFTPQSSIAKVKGQT